MARLLVVLTLTCVCFAVVQSSCLFRPKEQIFCEAAFVVSVTVTDVGPTSDDFIKEYTVVINQLFRNEKGFNKKTDAIYAPDGNVISIGISLTPGTDYLLSGYMSQGKPTVSSCEFVTQWSQVDEDMKTFLENHTCPKKS